MRVMKIKLAASITGPDGRSRDEKAMLGMKMKDARSFMVMRAMSGIYRYAFEIRVRSGNRLVTNFHSAREVK